MGNQIENRVLEKADRRQEERMPLDTPVFVLLQHGEESITCMLGDISIGGARMRLSPGMTAPEWLVQGRDVTIDEWPFTEFTDAYPFKAQVVWIDAHSCGVQFQSRLNLNRDQLAEVVEAAI
ncbi:PilZ domain-containing protein [Oleidesulfovibrio sp.]|uniref:PilZ domain-containing protein n=1 Tax=Oleidesulfovibrio sp. TaxID=2909707 RepID=UPI003A879D02